MKIIGCDFHPSYQQIMMLDTVTGEMDRESARVTRERRRCGLFRRGLEGPARVGIEASGQSQWFERMKAEFGHEVWIGDAAKIRASWRAEAEDRSARCGATDEATGGGSLSADLGAHGGRAGRAASCCCIGTSWCVCARK